MPISGLIVEYNPLHNGHQYHFSKLKETTGSDYTVAIMSGHFLQRGEPALFNKWIRTKMALEMGVDLVLELPVVFSCQSAELFAFGAIQSLEKLNIIDYLVFGSESNDISSLKKISEILAHEPILFQDLLKNELKKGLPFPSARLIALEKFMNCHKSDFKDIVSIINQPNNILGVEYIKWLIRLNSSIIPKTIQRIGSNYHDEHITTKYASATAIRKLLLSNDTSLDILQGLVPISTLSIMEEALNNNFIPGQMNKLSNSILSILFNNNAKMLENILDVKEGLNNRLINMLTTNSLEEYIDQVKTKRYTRTRIQRILCHILLNLKREDYQYFLNNGGVQYIRVLGFNEKGREILSKVKSNCSVPIITNLSKNYRTLSPIQRKMMDFDILATNLYHLHFTKSTSFQGNMDFYYGPIIKKQGKAF